MDTRDSPPDIELLDQMSGSTPDPVPGPDKVAVCELQSSSNPNVPVDVEIGEEIFLVVQRDLEFQIPIIARQAEDAEKLEEAPTAGEPVVEAYSPVILLEVGSSEPILDTTAEVNSPEVGPLAPILGTTLDAGPGLSDTVFIAGGMGTTWDVDPGLDAVPIAVEKPLGLDFPSNYVVGVPLYQPKLQLGGEDIPMRPGDTPRQLGVVDVHRVVVPPNNRKRITGVIDQRLGDRDDEG